MANGKNFQYMNKSQVDIGPKNHTYIARYVRMKWDLLKSEEEYEYLNKNECKNKMNITMLCLEILRKPFLLI